MEGGGRLARDPTPRLTAAEGRKFGLTVGTAFLVLGLILAWRDKETASLIVLSLGGLLFLAGLSIPGRLGPVFRAWMGLAHAISKVTTPIFMSIVYFLVLTPVGAIRRAVSRNPLQRERPSTSYWIPRDRSSRGSMERQF